MLRHHFPPLLLQASRTLMHKILRSPRHIVLGQLVPIKKEGDVELAGIPLLSLFDVGHERCEDGHGNFKFGESFSIHSPPFSKNLLCASYSMGSGEPYQVTRLYLKKSTFMHRRLSTQKFMMTFLNLLLHGVIGLVCDLIGRLLLSPSNITL